MPKLVMPKSHAPITVAFQGELGAFSFSAARKLLGAGIHGLPCDTFKSFFDSLNEGRASHAVIPIENTLHGSVHENYDHLVTYDLPIVSETSLRIEHNLIGVPGQSLASIRRAFSHPVALNQCLRFFDKHRRIAPEPFYDTAGSVKMLLAEKPAGAAAVASEDAAKLYGGHILKRNLEDNRQNFTRFFLLSKRRPETKKQTGEWKTSLVFATANKPGALFKAMGCFALRDLNLTKIESRPQRARPWEYLFYVDVLGWEEDEAVGRALKNLQEICSFFKILGSYRPVI